MRTFFRGRLVRVVAAASLITGIAVVSQGPPASAGVGVPACAPTGAVPDINGVYSPANTCVNNLQRTLVFVGESIISDGVNFAGTGSNVGAGGYGFWGVCVLVDWAPEDGTNNHTSVNTTPCSFNTTGGTYSAPGNEQFVGSTLSGTEGHNLSCNASPSCPFPVLPDANGASTLNWDPSSQPSCINSSGGGTSSFTAKNAIGNTETWTSNYTWSGSLNNFVGSIGNGAGTYAFNAKIETAAYPVGDRVPLGFGSNTAPLFDYGNWGTSQLDRTDAGCLDKTIVQKVPALGPGGQSVSSLIGLRDILVAGTATWDISAPGVG